jgi:hypothetical protein
VRDNAILPPTASGDGAGARFVTPTASGDGAGERFCAPLPPSPHFSGACPTLLGGTLKAEGTRKSRWSRVGTSKIIS